MTYANLVKEAKKAVKTVDAKTIKEHLAVEFDIEGKGEGAFYVEFSGNGVEVEPYEYYDHDFRVRTDAETALAILNGELDPEKAKAEGKFVVEGNVDRVSLLKDLLKNAEPEKKTKTTAKKPVPKKVAKKPATSKK
ncbi:MAG: SCP2 sterol-binding domain-containing protein [Acetatifactor sp.]|nr:SCP2 sterol-binding domain-containing protein [Acetatifactor sp.]